MYGSNHFVQLFGNNKIRLIVHMRAKEYIHISLILRRNAYISTALDIVLDDCSEILFI